MKVLLVATLMLLLSSGVSSQTKWKLEQKRDGVEVQTAAVEGSGYRAFKAITTLQETPEDVVQILQEIAGYGGWFAYLEKVSLVKMKPNAKVIYMETQFPWPFSNEDMFYEVTEEKQGLITRVSLRGIPSHRPPIAGIYRMKSARGFLEVTPLDGATQVTFVMHSELGGRVPLWMANQNIAELPIRTLVGLRKKVRAHRKTKQATMPVAPKSAPNGP